MATQKVKLRTKLLRKWRRSGGVRAILPSAIVSVITGLAMYASYWHIAYVASAVGEGSDTAHLEPIMIDALMVLSSQVRAADKARKMRPRRWATAMLLTTIALTFAANGASAYLRGHGVWGVVGASIPAIAVVGGSEMLSTRGVPVATLTRRRQDRATAKAARRVTSKAGMGTVRATRRTAPATA
jgi:hypothetical protein